MTTFSSNYFQHLNKTGESTYNVAFSGQDAKQYTIQKLDDPSATTFAAGDQLVLFSTNSSTTTVYTYIGSYEGGIVIEGVGNMGQPLGPFLFTNQPVPTNTTFNVDTETPYPVCFVKGTLITTSRGLVAIEDLVTGDTVQGSTGWCTVKWVGWRNYGTASLLTEESKSRITPVRIRAHAITDNVPSSDLLTSPWHHLLVDGKLVRAGDLVNGTTITQETHVTEVSYYHVELDRFDVILAHGIYSESWADGGNRDFFQNVDVTSLRPEDMTRRRAPRPGFDHLVLRKGKELAAIQRRVAQRAKSIASAKTKEQKAA